MKIVKPVLLAVILSFPLLAIPDSGHASRIRLGGPLEPSDSLSGLATLLSVQDSAQGRFAILKITLVSHDSDSSAIVHEFDNTRRMTRGEPLASLDLKRGEARSFIVRAAVARDQETRLTYKVKTRGADGSISEQMLHNRIPPDGPDPCREVDEYIQCPGGAVEGVEP